MPNTMLREQHGVPVPLRAGAAGQQGRWLPPRPGTGRLGRLLPDQWPSLHGRGEPVSTRRAAAPNDQNRRETVTASRRGEKYRSQTGIKRRRNRKNRRQTVNGPTPNGQERRLTGGGLHGPGGRAAGSCRQTLATRRPSPAGARNPRPRWANGARNDRGVVGNSRETRAASLKGA